MENDGLEAMSTVRKGWNEELIKVNKMLKKGIVCSRNEYLNT